MPDDKAIKNHSAERRLFTVRVIVFGLIMIVLLGLLLARLSWLQIFQYDYYQTRSQNNRLRVSSVQPVRGLIYDRNGKILAENLPSYYVVLFPEQVKNIKQTLEHLSDYISLSDSELKRFHKRLAQAAQFQAVPIRFDLSEAEVARFEVNQQQFPGLEIRAGLSRHYPDGKYTAHILGHVGSISSEAAYLDPNQYRGATQIGKSGVELEYEKRLRGYPGSRLIETNSIGREIKQINYTPPKSGDNLYLTIDSRLQKAAFKALGDYSGAVVALNPRNGQILAMASTPSYDPNLFVGGISSTDYKKIINDPKIPLFHRALQGQYPPGSVVKPVTAIAALESGVVDPDKPIYCPGYITLKGSSHRYRDWLRSGHGWIDMRQALYRSSDVYFYKQAHKMGIDTLAKYGHKFGLGQKTGVDLPNEKSGTMPSREWKKAHRNKSWYPGETLITAIGQGYMTATPLQLAQITSYISERGQAYQPHILRKYKNPQTQQWEQTVPQPDSPIKLKDPSEWNVIIDGMDSVINNPRGTAHYYAGKNLTAYTMAGKSGTAQVTEIKQGVIAPNVKDMPYNTRPHALFIAFAPIEDPKIAVAVVVEHGGGGSSVASPIARQVIDYYLLTLGALDSEPDTHKP